MGSAHVSEQVNGCKTQVLNNGRPSLFIPCENKLVVRELYDPVFVRDVMDDEPSLSMEDGGFFRVHGSKLS